MEEREGRDQDLDRGRDERRSKHRSRYEDTGTVRLLCIRSLLFCLTGLVPVISVAEEFREVVAAAEAVIEIAAIQAAGPTRDATARTIDTSSGQQVMRTPVLHFLTCLYCI